MRVTRKRFNQLFPVAALALVGWLVLSTSAQAAPVALNIKIIYAHNEGKVIDPKLEKLAKQFSKLSFSAYELKDEASFNLEIGASGRMQLPNGEWMSIRVRELSSDGKLRIEMVVEKLKFKTTVTIEAGGVLAVGGPRFEKGALILAVTRPRAT